MKLANVIKEARIKKGLSIRKLAEKINVDYSGLSKIEKGLVKKPGFIIIRRLSNELELNEIKLMKIAGYSETELASILNKKISAYKGMEDSKSIAKFKNDNNEIDIIKVLNGFKKDNLSIGEVIALIMCRIDVPLDEYLTEEDIKKHKINNFIEEWKSNSK